MWRRRWRCRSRATTWSWICRAALPPATPLRLTIRLAAPARIGRLQASIGLEKESKTVVARDLHIHRGRARTRDEAALRLMAQNRDEFGAVVGLGAQRFVRDDDRGPRQGGRRDSIEHRLRDADAVE